MKEYKFQYLHIFYENIQFRRGCSDHHLVPFTYLTNLPLPCNRYNFTKDSSYSHTQSFLGYMYVSPKAIVLVTTFVHSGCHMNVPCCKFETNINKHSRSYYIHILRSFKIITWLKLR